MHVAGALRAALVAPLLIVGSFATAHAEPDLRSSTEAAAAGVVSSTTTAVTPTNAPVDAAPVPAGAAAAPQLTEAPKPKPKPPTITLTADIDLTKQQLTVTAGGKVMHVWPISSGRAGYDTPRGTFRPQWAAKMHYSKQYDDAPMPHSVFFNGGIATHGTQATGMLGRSASHGCVRLAPANAATFYSLVHKHGFQSTRIVVRGTAKHREPEVARRDRNNDRQRYATRQLPPPGYGYVQRPAYGYPSGYGYVAPAYGYAPARRVYVMPAPGYASGQQRYLPPQGYYRY